MNQLTTCNNTDNFHSKVFITRLKYDCLWFNMVLTQGPVADNNFTTF